MLERPPASASAPVAAPGPPLPAVAPLRRRPRRVGAAGMRPTSGFSPALCGGGASHASREPGALLGAGALPPGARGAPSVPSPPEAAAAVGNVRLPATLSPTVRCEGAPTSAPPPAPASRVPSFAAPPRGALAPVRSSEGGRVRGSGRAPSNGHASGAAAPAPPLPWSPPDTSAASRPPEGAGRGGSGALPAAEGGTREKPPEGGGLRQELAGAGGNWVGGAAEGRVELLGGYVGGWVCGCVRVWMREWVERCAGTRCLRARRRSSCRRQSGGCTGRLRPTWSAKGAARTGARIPLPVLQVANPAAQPLPHLNTSFASASSHTTWPPRAATCIVWVAWLMLAPK